MPLESVLRKMEVQGITINVDAIRKLELEYETRQQEIITILNDAFRQEIWQICYRKHEELKALRKSEKGKSNVPFPEFNWNSNDQVGELFFEHLLPVEEGYIPDTQPDVQFAKTATGKWKCSEFVFESFLKNDKYKDIPVISVFCENFIEYIKLK